MASSIDLSKFLRQASSQQNITANELGESGKLVKPSSELDETNYLNPKPLHSERNSEKSNNQYNVKSQHVFKIPVSAKVSDGAHQ